MKKIVYFVVLFTLCFVACEPKDIAPDSLYISEKEVEQIVLDDNGVLFTLNEFVDSFMTEEGNFQNWVKDSLPCPYRDRATNDNGTYLFSIDTLPIGGPSIYIRGRVITEDHAGNFYKSMIIQQIVNDEQQTLRLSVDESSISGQYALGQEILIRVNGFSIGRYANQPQLCVPSYNNNIYANKANEKVGWAPGRIPASRFTKATTLIGTPDKSKIRVDEITIKDFINLSSASPANQRKLRHLDGNLVRLKGVHFTGQYVNTSGDALINCTTGDPKYDENANVFAPTTKSMGYPQSRVIADSTGNTTLVSTSEYAKYARFYLPGCDDKGVKGAKKYVGTITGILGYYRDNAGYAADKWDWSITIRSLAFMGWGTENDFVFKNAEGEEWIPKEYGAQ